MSRRYAAMITAVLLSSTLLAGAAHAQEYQIPGWISQVFQLYGDGLISDTEILNAIEYLVGEDIIALPSEEPQAGAYGEDEQAVLQSLSYDNDFVLVYEPTSEYDSVRTVMQERGMLEREVEYYSEEYPLPRDIYVVVRECGIPSAYWSPSEYEIVMCYELVEEMVKLHVQFSKPTDPILEDFVDDSVIAVFNHEVGHAMVTAYKLPMTGMEEDAVDQFAALNTLSFTYEDSDRSLGQEMLRSFALFWEYWDKESGDAGRTAYSGVHALSIQRHYNMACLLYGADPEYNQDLVDFGELPQDRAQRCEDEYQKTKSSWTRLIEPYTTPAWADLP